MGILGSLRAWQIGVLVAVLVIGAGTTYGVYAAVTGGGGTDLDENQQLVPVQMGDLVNDVSISGSIAFPNRESLTFGMQGSVGNVLVEEGQFVALGEPLAVLDSETVADLQKAVVQAEKRLRDAEESLTDAESGATILQMAQAEADVANAEVAYLAALDSLSGLLEPGDRELALAEAAVVNAEVSVRDSTEKLDGLLAGADADDLADAQARIDSANTTLANARADLDIAEGDRDEKVQSAQDRVDEASVAYSDVFEKWLGVELSDAELGSSPDDLLAGWNIDLAEIFESAPRFYDVGQFLETQGVPADDPVTVWDESVIYTWVNFFPGTIAATCDGGAAPFQGICIRPEMDQAWVTLDTAVDDLASVESQQSKAVTAAESVVDRAEDDVESAIEALAALQEDADPLDIEAAEKQLEVARATLQSAEDDLATLTGEPDPADLASKQKQVELAKAKLDGAGADLADLTAAVDPLEMAVLEADVTSAQAAVAAALADIEASKIVAPFDGLVSAVNVDLGQSVNPNTPVVEVVDPFVVEVSGVVDEIDVLFIDRGALAVVTMDALPGTALQGAVEEIAAQATNQQGVVTYPLSIRLDVPDGLALPEGLSAVANVVIREERDVLLVPLDALYGTFQEPLVLVSGTGGAVEERQVTLGDNDDFWVVVSDGLAEGEMVVMEFRETAGAGFAGLIGRPTGGFGGGFGFTGGGGQRPAGR